MPDSNAWPVVVAAAIGSLGGVVPAVVKHFSDIHQKKLDRKYKLEDEERQRALAIETERERRRILIQGDADVLFRLCLEVLNAQFQPDVSRALTDMKRWLSAHDLWLRSPIVKELFVKFLNDEFLARLQYEHDDPHEMHLAQAMIRDKLDQNALFAIAREYWS